MTYQCQYCKKDFARETSLAVHVCEPKRRRQERAERGVELGFQAYIRFYEMSQGSAKLKTFDKPFLTLFGGKDMVARGADRRMQRHIPGAAGQAHAVMPTAAHFIQEDEPQWLVEHIVRFLEVRA